MSFQPPPPPSPTDVLAFLLVAAVPLAVLALIGGIGYGAGGVLGEKVLKRIGE